MTLLVTGAAGFIGSAFLRTAFRAMCSKESRFSKIVIVDALTYAGRMENIESIVNNETIIFEKADIRRSDEVIDVFKRHSPGAVVHFAAESHVDNSIRGPQVFIETNVNGTFNLLEASRTIVESNSGIEKKDFRFLHVSTDEVFGALGPTGYFSESTPYKPNSPYSASKAASDHLVRAWYHTYGLPTIITNCSNNYGPRQFPEKLIPHMILTALAEENLPVYGQGLNIRDWIHVDDHAEGVWLALIKGIPGQSYCFGGNSERRNIDVVKSICKILDERRPRKSGKSYKDLITFVEDRKGHDFRYAIDDSYALKMLGYSRKIENFEKGLEQTIDWYLENQPWVQAIKGSGRK